MKQIPGKVMLTYVAEDMGGQNELMFSPAHVRTRTEEATC
jgi:hypothetical protein